MSLSYLISLRNLAGGSAAILSILLANFTTIPKLLKYRFRVFETSRYLTIRRLIWYWNGPHAFNYDQQAYIIWCISNIVKYMTLMNILWACNNLFIYTITPWTIIQFWSVQNVMSTAIWRYENKFPEVTGNVAQIMEEINTNSIHVLFYNGNWIWWQGPLHISRKHQ